LKRLMESVGVKTFCLIARNLLTYVMDQENALS